MKSKFKMHYDSRKAKNEAGEMRWYIFMNGFKIQATSFTTRKLCKEGITRLKRFDTCQYKFLYRRPINETRA